MIGLCRVVSLYISTDGMKAGACREYEHGFGFPKWQGLLR